MQLGTTNGNVGVHSCCQKSLSQSKSKAMSSVKSQSSSTTRMEVQCSVKCQVQFLRCFDVYVSVVELRAIQPYTKTSVNKYKGSNVPFNCSTVWGKQTHKIFLSPLPPITPKQRLLLWQNEMAESDRISLCLSSMITRQNKKQYRIRQKYDNSNVQLYVYRKLESVHK